VECARFMAESIAKGTSCIVHCSDGWDRTSQTVALAQLILDPFYRTIRGFEVLVEKDWLAFGFKFDDRCGHTASGSDGNESNGSKEVSPIFTQWIDAVYQMARKRPTAFEFNERFLLEVNEHAYSCLHGTFLGNCDKDRKDLRVSVRTQSLWTQMDARLDDFKNPFYSKAETGHLTDVDIRPSAFVVWSTMYNRFDSGIQPREYIQDVALNCRTHVDAMQQVVERREHQNGPSPPVALKWDSLLNADECSNCSLEFLSRFERRLHCWACGRIVCQRCFAPTKSTALQAPVGLQKGKAEHGDGGRRRVCKKCAMISA